MGFLTQLHRFAPRLSNCVPAMSFHSAVEKLKPSVKSLLNFATQDGTQLASKSDKDQSEVHEWIETIQQGDIVKETSLKDLDSRLVPRTYVVSNYLTAGDIALYGALHPVISKLQPSHYHSLPALTRYFDHIQSLPHVRKWADTVVPAFPLVSFELESAPNLERKIEPPKKKEKATTKPADVTAEASKIAATAEADATAADGKTQKKEKKEKKKESVASEETGKKKAGGGGKPAATAEEAGEPVPSMIDLRVGHIIDIKKHPDADGLYVEQIDIGEETGPRTVVSGLVHYIPIEEMRDKYLVAVCNLKPANMRGVKSFAMVLCATSKEGKEGGIELIQPPPNSKPGDRVYFEGAEFESATPLSQLNPKKKIFETVQPGFITLDTKEAAWVNPVTKSVHKIRTNEGVCLAPTLVGASLS